MTLVTIHDLNSNFLTNQEVTNELVFNYLDQKLSRHFEFMIADDCLYFKGIRQTEWEYVNYKWQTDMDEF